MLLQKSFKQKNEISSLQRQLAKSWDQRYDCERIIEKISLQNISLQRHSRDLERKFTIVKKNFDKKSDEFEKLVQQMSLSSSFISQLKLNQTRLESTNKDITFKLLEKEERCRTLQIASQFIDEKKSVVEKQNRQLNNALSDLNIKFVEKTSQFDSLTYVSDGFKRALDDAVRKLDSCESKLEDNVSRIEHYVIKISHLELLSGCQQNAIAALQSSTNKLKAENQDLTEENKLLKSNISRERENTAHALAAQKLQMLHNDSLRSMNAKSMQLSIEQLEKSNHKLKEQLHRLSGVNEVLTSNVSSLSKSEADLNSRCENQEAQIAENIKKIGELSSSYLHVKAKKDQAEIDISDLQRTRSQLNNTLVSLKTAMLEKDEALLSLHDENTLQQVHISDMERAIEKHEVDMEAYIADLTSSSASREKELEDALRRKDAQLEEMSLENAGLHDSLMDSEACEISVVMEELEVVQELAVKSCEIVRLEAALGRARNRIEDISDGWMKVEEEHEHLQNEVESLRDAVSVLEASESASRNEVQRLQGALSDLETSSASLERASSEKVSALELLVAEKEAAVSKLNEENTCQRAHISDLERAIEKHEVDMEAYIADLTSSSASREKELEDALRRKDAQLEEMSLENAGLHDSLMDSEACEISVVMEELEVVQELAAKSCEIVRLEAALGRARYHIEDISDGWMKVEEEHEHLQNEVESLRDAVSVLEASESASRNEVQRLQGALSDLETSSASLERASSEKVSALELLVAEKEAAVSKLNEENTCQRAHISDLERAMEKHEVDMEAYIADLTSSAASREKELEDELRRKDAQLEEMSLENAGLHDSLMDSEACEISVVMKELEVVQELAAKSCEIVRLEAALGRARNRIEVISDGWTKVEEEHAHLQNEVESLRHTVSVLEASESASMNEVQHLREKICATEQSLLSFSHHMNVVDESAQFLQEPRKYDRGEESSLSLSSTSSYDSGFQVATDVKLPYNDRRGVDLAENVDYNSSLSNSYDSGFGSLNEKEFS